MRLILTLGLLISLSAICFQAKAQELDVTEIVAASDAFTVDPSETSRTALVGALADYAGDPTVQSVNAYVSLLLHDGASGDNENLYETASAATVHLEPVADILPKQYLEARFLAAVAQFNLSQSQDAMIEMAHVEGRSRAYTDQLGERPEWATSLKWQADAWGMAMDAYFESSRESHPGADEIQSILASYGSDVASRNALAERSLDENGLPFCRGKMIQRPAMKHPSGPYYRGQFGSVILEFDLDAEGQVINPRVLASVPQAVFDEKSMRVVGKWKFKPENRREVGVTCRLERSNLIQPLTFELR